MITYSSDRLRRLIDGLLDYSRSENMLKEQKSYINLENLIKDISGLFSYENLLKIKLNSTLTEIFSNRTVIDQLLINLFANAIKYNDKNCVEIEMGVSETNTHYELYISDNGQGIDPKNHEKIFRIFEIIAAKDKFGETGNGIGLATVKKIIEKSGGSIKVESELGKGSKFIFTIEK